MHFRWIEFRVGGGVHCHVICAVYNHAMTNGGKCVISYQGSQFKPATGDISGWGGVGHRLWRGLSPAVKFNSYLFWL